MKLICATVLFMYCLLRLNLSFAQTTNFTTSDYWKSQKKEIGFGIGVSNLLGDLGGLDRIGTDYSPVDLEFTLTRPSAHIYYKYRIRPWILCNTIITYAMLKGDDQLTNEPARHYRNFRIRTHLIEISEHLELVVYNNEHYGARHKIRGLKGHKNKNSIFYIFSGISAFVYIPQAQYNGSWTNLRPLNTEGQGLPGGPIDYGLFNIGIPFGVGYKLGIDEIWRINFELSYTKTFTDYLDDVSSFYYDNDLIRTNYGDMAADLADPSSGIYPGWTAHGQMRGDKKHKDAYLLFNVSLVKNLTQKNKKRLKWRYHARF